MPALLVEFVQVFVEFSTLFDMPSNEPTIQYEYLFLPVCLYLVHKCSQQVQHLPIDAK